MEYVPEDDGVDPPMPEQPADIPEDGDNAHAEIMDAADQQ
jgi:hypothetical protein